MQSRNIIASITTVMDTCDDQATDKVHMFPQIEVWQGCVAHVLKRLCMISQRAFSWIRSRAPRNTLRGRGKRQAGTHREERGSGERGEGEQGTEGEGANGREEEGHQIHEGTTRLAASLRRATLPFHTRVNGNHQNGSAGLPQVKVAATAPMHLQCTLDECSIIALLRCLASHEAPL